jgi:hypothetical protein
MIAVRNVGDFFRHNDQDLRKFMVFKTGIYDREVINDALQEFYVRLIRTRALETYDENAGAFDTYVMNLFCWMLPILRSKNFRYNYNVVSTVKNEKNGEIKESDVWDYVSGRGSGTVDFIPRSLIEKKRKKHKRFKDIFEEERKKYMEENGINAVSTSDATYNVDPRYISYTLDRGDEVEARTDLKEFIVYVTRTEPENRCKKILDYIKYKMNGCSNSDISKLMGVSNTMIRVIRNQAWERYRIWLRMYRS